MPEDIDFSTRSRLYLKTKYSAENAEMIQERLYKMIEYARDRYDWYESQREKRVSLALGMLTLAGVAMSVIVGSAKSNGIDPNSLVFKLSGLVLISVIIASFSVFLIYLRGQNVSYTHRRGLNSIYSWYHYGVPKDTHVSFLEYIICGRYSTLLVQSENQTVLDLKQSELSSGFENFCRKVIMRWDRSELRFDEDLQQVFVLHVLQSISRDNLRMMTAALKFGTFLVFSAVVGLALQIALFGVPVLTTGG